METKLSFSTLYCAHFKCAPKRFEKHLFWHCLHPRARLAALVIRLFNRGFFHDDDDLITEIKNASSFEEVNHQINSHCLPPIPGGWLRNTGKVRLSKTKIKKLARELFKPASP